MQSYTTLQALFKRYRRPGDIVFAILFLVFSLFLLSQLGNQTTSKEGGKLLAQPWFWPLVSLSGMTFFAALHTLGSFFSTRIDGRWREVSFWSKAFEYVAYFMVYVWLVPIVGYLLGTILAALILTYRAGYRLHSYYISALIFAVAVVLIFKTFLQVKIPGGAVYEFLPTALRSFMLTYF